MIGVGIDLFRYGGGGGAEPTSLFNVVTYTGNGSTQAITVGFQPDFVWIKNRSASYDHMLYDSIRGAGNYLESNTTDAEASGSHMSSFNSDGFTVEFALSNRTNFFGQTYVAWCWKAGGTAVTNTDGTITSQVSANVDAGFSIVNWTATSNGYTVGHGLSSAPELIITKSRARTTNWWTFTTLIDGSVDFLGLNLTNAKADDSIGLSAPTSTVFSMHSGYTSTPTDVIAYCFHSVEGFSKIGTYSGTGSDQAITGLGFQPDFVLIKRTDSTGNWCIADSARLTSGESNFLYPNLNNAESVSAVITMESDGFSMDGSDGDYNASGGTYIYMAIKGSA